jgi:alpha-L-rhamnosidase
MTADPTVQPVGLRTGDAAGLVATGTGTPRLSWRLGGDRPDARQHGYEVQAAADLYFRHDVVSTGPVDSSRQVGAPMPGPALRSRQVRWWRVRVRTDRGWTQWSGPSRVEAALLEAADWHARPITLSSDVGRAEPGPPPVLRREFDLPAGPVTARLYVSALGVHDTLINGRPVGDDLLEPGWTSYPHRLLYATYDVTRLLQRGGNTIAATVGDGWYRGALTWHARRNVYGDASALLAQLEVTLADGSTVTVGTDGSWRASTGEVRAAGLYEGCDIDRRRGQDGWQLPGYDDGDWQPAKVLPLPAGLRQRAMPGVRVVQLRPATVDAVTDGSLRVDAGQNVTGYLRITATGPEGATVTVRHAEVLDAHGHLYTAPLRKADAVDRYVLSGGGPDVLEPRFTFHGFRYATIDRTGGARVLSAQVAVVASDLPRTGEFACSNELVNRLYENVVWSQRGNFLAVPTDCPQRDERLGWTGDIQVFAATACHNFDSQAFLANWLRDVSAEQREDGCVPNVVPNVLPPGHRFEWGSAGWADAVAVVPWALYETHGDPGVLTDHYDTACRWVDWGASRLDPQRLWSRGFHFGDWLDPNAPSDRPEEALTPTGFVATAYLSHSAGLVSAAARVLGRADEAERYARLRHETASAAWRHYGEQATTQTGCAIALQLGIAPEADRSRVGDRLAELVRKAEGRIATGFLGTPLVLPALSATGHHEEAYQLLLNERCPGWLHQVRHGATTVWERWDAIREDGTVHSGKMAGEDGEMMLSFNHYAYGAVASWLYRTVAGIAPTAADPGYRMIVFAPVPGGGLTWAGAEMKTGYGTAAIRWERDGDRLTVDITVPLGAEGVFVPPPGWRPADPPFDGSPLAAGRHRLALTAVPVDD